MAGTTTSTIHPARPPSQRITSPGCARPSTYPATALLLRRAPQPPPTCAFPPPTHTHTHSTYIYIYRRTGLNDGVDVSREAQLASIESSFGAARGADELGVLRHPTKPRLRAVATYEVLPDADVWANAYDLFRFSERPGERGPEVRHHTPHPMVFFFFWDLFFEVAGRPPVGLRDYAAYGIGRGSLPDLLPHQR